MVSMVFIFLFLNVFLLDVDKNCILKKFSDGNVFLDFLQMVFDRSYVQIFNRLCCAILAVTFVPCGVSTVILWCDHPTATYILHMYSNIILFMHTFSLNIQIRIHNMLSLADTLSTLPYKERVIYASMPRLTICIQFPFILSSLSSFLK